MPLINLVDDFGRDRTPVRNAKQPVTKPGEDRVEGACLLPRIFDGICPAVRVSGPAEAIVIVQTGGARWNQQHIGGKSWGRGFRAADD
jgi:hypothetical protein